EFPQLTWGFRNGSTEGTAAKFGQGGVLAADCGRACRQPRVGSRVVRPAWRFGAVILCLASRVGEARRCAPTGCAACDNHVLCGAGSAGDLLARWSRSTCVSRLRSATATWCAESDAVARRGDRAVLNLPLPVKIFWLVAPTDMRKSFDSLSTIVAEQLKQDPLSGHLFICNRSM